MARRGAGPLSYLRPGVLLRRRLERGLAQRAAQIIDDALVLDLGVDVVAMNAFTADRIA